MAKEILIAESDKRVQEEFQRIFKATDHHLSFAESDEEVLLRGKLTRPDLIIGGKRLCHTVKAERDLEKIPFIILLDMFEDLSEKECKFLGADGIISRPLNENEILRLVNHFDDGVKGKVIGKPPSEGRQDWKSFSDRGKEKTDSKEDFFLDASWDTDEEIIELVDVVEEPEPRMSIDDFAFQPKEELVGEIAPIETWETRSIETEDLSKEMILPPVEEKEDLEGLSLALEKERKEEQVSLEKDLFEKIELEEILRKVEELQPSIEKEFQVEKEDLKISKITPEKMVPPHKKPDSLYNQLNEFEAALKAGVKVEPTEEILPPLIYQEPPQKTSESSLSLGGPEEFGLQELEEEFSESLLEELSEELEKLEEEELVTEEMGVTAEAETALEEEISELLGEEEIEPLVKPSEEVTPMEEVAPLPTPSPMEEMIPVEELVQLEAPVQPSRAMPEVTELPEVALEGIPSPAVRLDRKIEEVITQGVQEMMQDFIQKIIPEMTTKMITLTLDRIEQMVKEVVPEIAERAIREEIQRLQKGEKD